MPPPPPPPPPKLPSAPLNPPTNTAQKTKKTNNEVVDKNALLSQIRQGTKLKKATTNDRSAPIVANAKSSTGGLSSKQNDAKPITPSMFKNGAGPLNLNFKLPSGIGPSSLNKTKPNSSLNSASSKSTTSTNSLSSKTSIGNDSFNSSANNIAKSLTLKSPAKSQLNDKLSTTNYNSNTLNKLNDRSSNYSNNTLNKSNDRPPNRPPPLPLKPPNSTPSTNSTYVNRRQSFDSGQIVNKLQSTINSSNDNNNSNKFSKPAPPPRFGTVKSTNDLTNRQNSTQNIGSNSSVTMNNYSTMKIKTNTKTYPSTRPLGPPPPIPSSNPPTHKATAPTPLQNKTQIYNSNNSSNLNTAPKPPPPPPNFPLSAAPLPPLPPSITSVTPNSYNNNHLNIAPMPPIRNSSNLNTCKDLESRFQNQFKDESYLPAPDTFTNCKKVYCSAAGSKSVRSRAPLPPNENQKPFNQQMLNV